MTNVYKCVACIIAKNSGIQESMLTRKTRLDNLGMKVIDALKELESYFQIYIGMDGLYGCKTINDLVVLCEEKLNTIKR